MVDNLIQTERNEQIQVSCKDCKTTNQILYCIQTYKPFQECKCGDKDENGICEEVYCIVCFGNEEEE